MKNNENPTNTERLMGMSIGESLYKPTLRSGVGTPVTVVALSDGTVGISYRVNETHRQGTDYARLDEQAARWLNGWDLYDTQDEATAAAQARLAGMSGIEQSVIRYGSH
jgi:hypothetical protein